MANNKPKKYDSLLEHILVEYRWVFVCFFLLPLSFFYNFLFDIRNWVVFRINSAPQNHDNKVKNIQKQIRKWQSSGKSKGQQMCTARPGWQTMSFRQPKYKHTSHRVECNLVDVLHVDGVRRVVRVEPLATMGQVSKQLAHLGWTLPIVPELDDLTVGGLIMGTGIESSSHIYGLFQHICVAYELVLADGSVTHCSKDENPDLFYAVPWSYGTLGFLTAATIKIIPATSFIKLEYNPVKGLSEIVSAFKTASENKLNHFVETLMYSADEAVVMTGRFADNPDDGEVNCIGKWYKPWFYLHCQEILKRNKIKIEYIPLVDYYHRHTKSLFWEMQDIVPFGNNILFRLVLGWMVPIKVSLLKLTQTDAIKKLYENNHIIQDMLVPCTELRTCLQFFHDAVNVYPIWLCPFRLPNDPGMLQQANVEGDRLFVDIGVYGVPGVKNFQPEKTIRSIEDVVERSKGFQMLYADTYRSREEFRKMFNHTLYDKMRKSLNGCTVAFPDVYDKVSKQARY